MVLLDSASLACAMACVLLFALQPDPSTIVSVAVACAMAAKPNRARRLVADAQAVLSSESQPFIFEDREDLDDRDGGKDGAAAAGEKSFRSNKQNLTVFLTHKRNEVEAEIARVTAFLDLIDGGGDDTTAAAKPSKKRKHAGDDGDAAASKPASKITYDITDLASHYTRTFLLHDITLGTARSELVTAVFQALYSFGLNFMLRHRSSIEAKLPDAVLKTITHAFSKADGGAGGGDGDGEGDGAVTASSCQLRWSKVFSESNAGAAEAKDVWLEVCSGSGDWIISQVSG